MELIARNIGRLLQTLRSGGQRRVMDIGARDGTNHARPIGVL